MLFQGGKIMKVKRIIAFLIGTALLGTILYLYFGFNGSFLVKLYVNSCAQDYIEETYQNEQLNIDEVVYNFKDGLYYVKVSKPNSQDIHFSISYTWNGTRRYDEYENMVLSKWNTMTRLDMEYRDLVQEVLTKQDFPLPITDIAYGDLQEMEDAVKYVNNKNLYTPFGIDTKSLKIDGHYDIKELGKIAGVLTLYVEDEEVSIDKATQYLILLKDYMDKNNIPFYAVDFVLQKPNRNEESINLIKFLYKDIQGEDLKKKVEENYQKTQQYYHEWDQEKDAGRV